MNQEIKFGREESPRELFVEEIGALRDKEISEAKEGRATTAHFASVPDFEPSMLDEADRVIWERVKSREVTMKDIREYGRKLDEELKNGADAATIKTRGAFKAFINNKATPIIMERYPEDPENGEAS